jgi:hypothetical protein
MELQQDTPEGFYQPTVCLVVFNEPPGCRAYRLYSRSATHLCKDDI